MATDHGGVTSRSVPSAGNDTDDVRRVAKVLARKWRLEVLEHLQQHGPVRFNELKRELGTTAKVLTECLTELTDAELVDRTVYSEAPPHVEYDLADSGYELQRIVAELATWRHKTDRGPVPTVLVVDSVVRTNNLYTEWMEGDYETEQVVDPETVDQDQFDRADVILYHHHPLKDAECTTLARIRSGDIDAGVVTVTVQRQSSTAAGTGVELIEPVLREELLQAVTTVLHTQNTTTVRR